ncbi:MAG: hypothetical protein JW776_11895 [Candidatus Lokiarchaeota archaeon]|nr:hypothetical protein [Candidatus Lokiarchaeota archaeon]
MGTETIKGQPQILKILDKQYELVLYKYIFPNVNLMQTLNKITLESHKEESSTIEELKTFMNEIFSFISYSCLFFNSQL